jgi:hypothetical protein
MKIFLALLLATITSGWLLFSLHACIISLVVRTISQVPHFKARTSYYHVYVYVTSTSDLPPKIIFLRVMRCYLAPCTLCLGPYSIVFNHEFGPYPINCFPKWLVPNV